MMSFSSFYGKGLGLRKQFLQHLIDEPRDTIDFLEITPENWLGLGGYQAEGLKHLTNVYPTLAHGLNLSIGGPAPLNYDLLTSLKHFFRQTNIRAYSEHFSFCSDNQGLIYDLLPIPFTEEAVLYISERIRQAQDFLEQPIAFENSSYYYIPEQNLTESEFINAVVAESGCLLLLDVNNVYVNSKNHGYDAKAFIQSLPTDAIAYIHIAGHWQKTPDLIIDTHGDAVCDEVWNLLAFTYQAHTSYPTLLERDNDIPPLTTLIDELNHIGQLQQKEVSHV
ncbi:DUF692 domain-containing protein [Legionella sp. W05-934-2]|jgi:uncharacterized protein (UPF0276 family)|uniref:HvfB family MNIO-type RiPP peptide maturase n=1 Tax=Legionella sp. W05-934-2 TaxID=1198649 RepID=UPI003463118E